MFTPSEIQWLEVGCDIFSQHGPAQLRVEEMARRVGISKSSFYHHFADMKVFTERMMEWHLKRSQSLAAEVKTCNSFDPGFLQLLVKYRTDIFFNRMLRIHRDNISYQLCYQNGHSAVEKEVLPLWIEWLGLTEHPGVAQNIFTVTVDLFYQRISAEHYTYEWMTRFLSEVKLFLKDIIRGSGINMVANSA